MKGKALMIKKSNGRIGSIQLLRALACISVMFSHTRGVATWGACGVDFFYIISGFVIMIGSMGGTALLA